MIKQNKRLWRNRRLVRLGSHEYKTGLVETIHEDTIDAFTMCFVRFILFTIDHAVPSLFTVKEFGLHGEYNSII